MSIQYRFPIQSQHLSLAWDKLGATLSFACALHCALQPILLAVLPLLGLGFLMNERLETAFLVFSVILATYSVASGARHHGQKQAFPVLALGILCIGMSRVWEAYEPALAIVGALSIVAAHVYNMKLHQRYHQH